MKVVEQEETVQVERGGGGCCHLLQEDGLSVRGFLGLLAGGLKSATDGRLREEAFCRNNNERRRRRRRRKEMKDEG